MAEARLITAYLAELHHDIRRLADADEIAAEVEDHLLEARDAFQRRGLDPLAAELQALAQFGTPSLVSQAMLTESRKGAAVATTFTRRAGLAAMLLPALALIGAVLFDVGADKSLTRNIGIVLFIVTLPLFVVVVLGLWRRHRDALGAWGAASMILFVASPVLAAPFGWGAGAAFAIIVSVAAALLAIGMLRAGVLPRLPVALFGFAGVIGIVGTAVADALGLNAPDSVAFGFLPAVLGITVVGVGLGWLGWVMWHEDALDASSGPAPLATA